MARQFVLTMAPAAQVPAANDFMVGMFGDDPGSQEIRLNAYLDGRDSSVATHSIGVSNCSQAEANTLVNYLTATPGCDGGAYPMSPTVDWWAEATRLWNLKQVPFP